MTDNNFEVIIIGGSYSGLSAAMSLGRSLRKVLIIDSGKRCNQPTPHAHNFITHDGKPPQEIADMAKKQVLAYETVNYYEGLAATGRKAGYGFEIQTDSGAIFKAKKLIFATGVKDIMPEITGFLACWGISVLHCPYCHGYEVRGKKTGILLNGMMAFEFSKMIKNLTDDLTIFTNGQSMLTPEQTELLNSRNIQVEEKTITEFVHDRGYLSAVIFNDRSKQEVAALYAHPDFAQHCYIPEQLGCKLNDQGLLEVDDMQRTNVEGVYACGDNSSPMRALAMAIAAGTMAGAALNKELVEEEF
ncbi:NAD(P)/FAD-dependent oxidoreductase [Fulvivirgaceae bacterium BMA12]|uniref:NAD(P)/FAD-dependent oxidoreductase n=1 Tax=Agaribacillus aureus TaxID=3051825 RepID=A0ABT8LCQ7_9BACT|nr:NAD(P)/FAD-dependent oxidoreductase [Fulvivirgaceae bacterium BMA12]